MMPSKELKNAFLGRRRKEKEGEREEGRRYSIEDFLPTVNNYDTHCIILIDKIPKVSSSVKSTKELRSSTRPNQPAWQPIGVRTALDFGFFRSTASAPPPNLSAAKLAGR